MEDGFGAVPGGCQVICVPSAVVWVWMENPNSCMQKKTQKNPNPTPESKVSSTQPFSSFLDQGWDTSKEPWMVLGNGEKPLWKGAGAAVGTGINSHPGNSNVWHVFEMLKALQIFTPSWASCQILEAPVAPLVRGWCVTIWGSGASRCTDVFFKIDSCPLGFPTQQN